MCIKSRILNGGLLFDKHEYLKALKGRNNCNLGQRPRLQKYQHKGFGMGFWYKNHDKTAHKIPQIINPIKLIFN